MGKGDIENCNFKLVSQNVRGLKTDKVKRETVFNYLKSKGDIVFLQETHSTLESENLWKNECGCEMFFSHGASNSSGVMIFFSNNLEIEIKEQVTDDSGRFLLLKCIVQGTKIILYNVYAPNNEKTHADFLLFIKEKLSNLDTTEYDYFIGAGDWNFTIEKIDRSGGNYNYKNWQKNATILDEINEKYDLIDIWRVRYPEKTRFTWRRTKPVIQSRIDRFYISDTMQYNISKTDIIPGIHSDHSAIVLSIKPTKSLEEGGPNFWKFNNSLLKNDDFTKGLKLFIENDIKNECKEIKCSQVKWEYTKFKIKQWSIKKSKEIAANRRKMEINLTEKISKLEEVLISQPNEQSFENLEKCKTELEKIHDQKTQSLIIQSRVQIYEEGEKSTKFFLNQIKQNKRKSTIRKLIDGNQEIVDQKEILIKLKDFYSNLYSKNENCKTGGWIQNLKQNGLIPQISENEATILDAPLTLAELKEILEKCAKNKSPGNDGLTQEFYSYFWEVICQTLYESYLESIKKGKLSTSQRQNIISLLEKAGKDKTFIKNWRPISLINFDTKLFSKTYAERLKIVMPSLVHPNQVAYVKNRFIGEGIRTIEETMHYTKNLKIEAYAVAIDFEKAFDSIDWDYLWEALAAYNIPKSFIDMMKLLYKDTESCVKNNGTSTPYFKIKRGVRQGDPIAAYLFTLAIELLAIEIRENKNIEGIQVNKTKIKLSMYADDMTGLVVGIASIKSLMKIMNEFKIYSGLGVNDEKTEIMPLGASKKNDNALKNLGYKIVSEMKVTGVTFTYEKQIFRNKNFTIPLTKMKTMFNIWKQRNLSILGKVQIIKTYGTSQLIYIINMISTPIDILKQANAIFYNFLWNGPDKIKRNTMIADYDKGGLKMPHIESIVKTQKIMWAKRFISFNFHPWKEFLSIGLNKIGINNIMNRVLSEKIIESSDMSTFNKDILISWSSFQTVPVLLSEIGNQYLWNNTNIRKPNGTPLNSHRLSKIGINQVMDLIKNENKKIISINDINSKNITILEKLELASVIKCLPRQWKEEVYTQNNFLSFNCQRKRDIEKKMKSKTVYKNIIQKIIVAPSSESFFKNNFDIENKDFAQIYSIPFNATIYTKLRAFQFKINHNILYTNEKLHRIKISESPLCTFCNNETETLEHLFVDCDVVANVWQEVLENLLQPFGVTNLTKSEVILGFITTNQQNSVINHIILETKYFIYVCKLEKCKPLFSRLKKRLKITENIEKQIAIKTNKISKHTHKWHHITNYLLY